MGKVAVTPRVLVVLAVLFLAPFSVYAATVTYAKVAVYFNVPADTSFSVAFPSSYTIENVTDGSAPYSTTSWISFNFTTTTQTWVQPQTTGYTSNVQSGPTKPIFRIDNTGNKANDISLNSTIPATFAVCANATCAAGTCGTVASSCTTLGVSFSSMASALSTGGRLNVTLYANDTISPAGQSTGDIFIRSQ